MQGNQGGKYLLCNLASQNRWTGTDNRPGKGEGSIILELGKRELGGIERTEERKVIRKRHETVSLRPQSKGS